MAMAMPSGLRRAVSLSRRPTLTTDTTDLRGNKIEHQAGDFEVESFGQASPAGDCVDFDGVKAAIAAGQQIDAGDWGVDGGGGAAGDIDERIVGREGLGGRAAADVGAPVELI